MSKDIVGNTLSQMTLAALEVAASPIHRQDKEKLFRRMSQAVIYMRCTDRIVMYLSVVAGIVAVFLQTISLSTEYWLFTIEPRPIKNVTDANGDILEIRFQYHSGYWRMCKERYSPFNETLTEADKELHATAKEFRPICLLNKLFTSNDEIGQEARPTSAIMNRIQVCSLIHILGLAGTTVATVYSILGYYHVDRRTLISGIVYIVGGLAIAVAVMQYICVVDDEMAPRMKPNAEGEPSKYEFSYGYSFLMAALSFLLTQICAISQLILYLRRYSGLEGKMEIVPGLKEKIRRAYLEHDLPLTSPTHLKGNLPGHNSPLTHHRSASASPPRSASPHNPNSNPYGWNCQHQDLL